LDFGAGGGCTPANHTCALSNLSATGSARVTTHTPAWQYGPPAHVSLSAKLYNKLFFKQLQLFWRSPLKVTWVATETVTLNNRRTTEQKKDLKKVRPAVCFTT
jgi:hypothetical protein